MDKNVIDLLPDDLYKKLSPETKEKLILEKQENIKEEQTSQSNFRKFSVIFSIIYILITLTLLFKNSPEDPISKTVRLSNLIDFVIIWFFYIIGFKLLLTGKGLNKKLDSSGAEAAAKMVGVVLLVLCTISYAWIMWTSLINLL